MEEGVGGESELEGAAEGQKVHLCVWLSDGIAEGEVWERKVICLVPGGVEVFLGDAKRGEFYDFILFL